MIVYSAGVGRKKRLLKYNLNVYAVEIKCLMTAHKRRAPELRRVRK